MLEAFVHPIPKAFFFSKDFAAYLSEHFLEKIVAHSVYISSFACYSWPLIETCWLLCSNILDASDSSACKSSIKIWRWASISKTWMNQYIYCHVLKTRLESSIISCWTKTQTKYPTLTVIWFRTLNSSCQRKLLTVAKRMTTFVWNHSSMFSIMRHLKASTGSAPFSRLSTFFPAH